MTKREYPNMFITTETSPLVAPDDDDLYGWGCLHDITTKTFRDSLGDVFNEHGEVRARFCLLSLGEGRRIVTHSVVPLQMTKDECVFVVRRFARTIQAFASYFASETWMVLVNHPEGKDVRRAAKDVYEGIDSLEQHPQRIEAVYLALESLRADRFGTYAQIDRPKEGRPSLTPWVEVPAGMDFAGRFAYIVTDPPKPRKAAEA